MPVLSILRATPSVQSTIRENKLTQLENIMVTSKNEGMFTMKQYEKEFLSNRLSSFVHPHKSFSMAAESSKEKDYVSSLIDPNAIQDVIYMSTVDDASKANGSLKLTASDEEEQRYLILEEHDMNLQELLAQFDEKADKKNPHK